jgi:hypothetical protein
MDRIGTGSNYEEAQKIAKEQPPRKMGQTGMAVPRKFLLVKFN